MHFAGLGEAGHVADVDIAPDAAGFARGDASGMALPVHTALHAVDPAEAEQLVDSLRVGDSALAEGFLAESDQQLRRDGMVLLQSAAEISGRGEVSCAHGRILRVVRGCARRFFGCGRTPRRESRWRASATSLVAMVSKRSADSGR